METQKRQSTPQQQQPTLQNSSSKTSNGMMMNTPPAENSTTTNITSGDGFGSYASASSAQLVQRQPLPPQAEMFRAFMTNSTQTLQTMQETNRSISELANAVAHLIRSRTESTNVNALQVVTNKKRKSPGNANTFQKLNESASSEDADDKPDNSDDVDL
jgi:hypothetical protein